MAADHLFANDGPFRPLDLLPYAAHVGRLVRSPGVLQLWRQRCQEAFQEYGCRFDKREAWEAQRKDYAAKEWKQVIPKSHEMPQVSDPPPREGCTWGMEVLISPDGLKTWFVEGWAPPEFDEKRRPFVGTILPFSDRHTPSLADCYFVLALIHDAKRPDAFRINPVFDDSWGPLEEVREFAVWQSELKNLANLDLDAQLTLDDCMHRVEIDLKDQGLLGVIPNLPNAGADDAEAASRTQTSVGKTDKCLEGITILITEHQAGRRITIKSLAEQMGVGRAALYERKEFEKLRHLANQLFQLFSTNAKLGDWDGHTAEEI
jgi:hypothetical protein